MGGFLGTILRYSLENVHIYNYKENIPLNTLLINITGSFILALILTVAFEILEFDPDIRIGLATGFLGGYTTFSTLCKESVNLIAGGFYYSALSYLTISAVLGIASVYFGVVLARKAIRILFLEKGIKYLYKIAKPIEGYDSEVE